MKFIVSVFALIIWLSSHGLYAENCQIIDGNSLLSVTPVLSYSKNPYDVSRTNYGVAVTLGGIYMDYSGRKDILSWANA